LWSADRGLSGGRILSKSFPLIPHQNSINFSKKPSAEPVPTPWFCPSHPIEIGMVSIVSVAWVAFYLDQVFGPGSRVSGSDLKN
jgi:hypothetical protein